MAVIFIFIFILFLLYRTETIARYGKSIVKPDFKLVDKTFYEKKKVITNWDTVFGKIVYYGMLLFSLLLMIVFMLLLIEQIKTL